MNQNRKKKGNYPNLRFPEFEGEWEEYRIQDIIQMFSGGTPSMQNIDYWGGDIPFISAKSMHQTYISTSTEYITAIGLKKGSRLLKKSNLLLLVRGSMLWNRIPICLNLTNVAFNQDVKGLVVNHKTSPLFVLFWFQAKETLIKNLVTGTGIGAGKLDSETILSLQIELPIKEEQTKISELLSLIDQRIETQRKIIEGYESLIKGLSEKLFSQQIRFKNKNGNKYSDWRIKMLEEIGESFNGLSGKNKDDFGEGKLYIQYKQIFSGSTINVNECGLVNIYNGENQSKVQYGDVFFTVSSETPDEIGMSSVLIDEVDEMYLNSFCFGVRPSSLNLVNPLYMSFLLRASIFRSKVIKLAQGSTRYNLSKVALMKLAIPLPLMEEQKQIAQFLLSIGTKIRVESSILEKYQSQKMYILQNLFI